MKKREIKRTGDLAPKGVRSTFKGNYGFNETFEQIFKESRKPDESWKITPKIIKLKAV
jgi:hypothetical protein